MKGTGYIFLVTAYITHPVVEVNFGVFQPLGYNVSCSVLSSNCKKVDGSRVSSVPSDLTSLFCWKFVYANF